MGSNGDGEGGRIHVRRKRQITKETREKISKALTGKRLSEETKKKISESRKGKRVGDENPSKRPEVRRKISLALTGKPKHKVRCDLIPSARLAYLLGVRYGDGKLMIHPRTSQFSFGLTVKDKEFVQKFQEVANKIVNKKRAALIWKTKRGYWGYTVYSKELFQYLKKPIQEHDKVINRFSIEFIRGFFDSEGSVFGYSVRMSNDNKELLGYVQKLLGKLGIESKLHSQVRPDKHNKVEYHLSIAGRNRAIFAKIVGCTIQRKLNRLNKFTIGGKRHAKLA